MKDIFSETSKFTVALNINNMSGRVLRLPKPDNKKREILLLYGHHASHERMFGIAEELNKYGGVTMPDFPGFGGMDSFYSIGMKPTIDNYADYLATFLKLKSRNKKITIVAMSYGFVIATRMLQRYPELCKKVELLVSVVGFSHKDDFAFSQNRHQLYWLASKIVSMYIPAIIFKNIALHPLAIRTTYAKTHNAKKKFEHLSSEDTKKALDFEIYLWHANDLRTHMATTAEFLRLNNCIKQVDLPVWHIAVDGDQYFKSEVVEQHMRIIFNDFYPVMAKMKNHAPSIIASADEAAPLFPRKIRELLDKEPA